MIELLSSLEAAAETALESKSSELLGENNIDINELDKPMHQETKLEKIESPYSKEINDAANSEQEIDIYKEASLVEQEVNDKPALVRTDIDPNQVDDFGRTNAERMEKGLAPLDKTGKPIELHHIGQKENSPLAELTQEEHHCNGNDSILHDKTKESEIDRNKFSTERKEHWQARAKDFQHADN